MKHNYLCSPNRHFIFCALLSIFVLTSCKKEDLQFDLLASSKTGIEFSNVITESDSFNIITYEYIYNGGGVAIADFNNDGLQDIYFTGNMVPNALYLNEGGMQFKDVTTESNTGGEGKWSSGVAAVDINGDGWKDLYVCATAHPQDEKRANMLYINMGPDEEGIPRFVNMAQEYGVADMSHATNAVFFDYDNDGDLDLFIAINKMEESGNPNIYRERGKASPDRVDKLYQNNWDQEKGHPVFTDVSAEAGIIYDGYSLGVSIADINQDGWKDIYVANDYITMDLMYINQGDGTFRDMGPQYFKHTSHSAMGTDIVDLTNNGYPDVVVVDMLPEDNYRKKTMLPPNNYTTYINNDRYGYQYQYVRNTVQLNLGTNPESGNPVFGETGFMSGISSTDWSWAPMIADFDNDGLRDIIITNGFPRDVTDRDYVDYYSSVGNVATNTQLLAQMPSVKIKNYAYRNLGKGVFDNVTEEWGVREPSFSNGAAYADLDNDGDLDYVVNNINDKAFVYQNRANDRKSAQNNWIKIKLKGNKGNPSGIGTILKAYHGGQMQYCDHNTYRGYLSSVDEHVYFGLGNSDVIDSLIVIWPLGVQQKLVNLQANQTLEVDSKNATKAVTAPAKNAPTLLQNISQNFEPLFVHQESDHIDYNIQPLLPHKLSQYGPGIAVGDVNGDGLDDLYIGGSHFNKGTFLIQNADHSFTPADLLPGKGGDDKIGEELGVLLFDADADGDLDLYLVHGGYEFEIANEGYQDKFFENVDGQFVYRAEALPRFLSSGSCVKGADFDRDGDIDLFVGGRLQPHQYPKPVDSYILENRSTPGNIRFEIVNDKVLPALYEFGMVCDALWTDFNNDGWADLVVAGEWMPVRFFANEQGVLKEVTSKTGIGDQTGWWNSIVPGDFDNDGDLDYIVGNVGLNTIFSASEKYPVSIYAADFDGNKGYDIIPTSYCKDVDGQLREFPFFSRLDIQKQIIKVKAQFLKHAEFGRATINDILNQEQLDSALIYRANYMSSAYIENKGNGKFEMRELPMECQVAPVYGMLVEDFNHDGNKDVLMVGNDFGTELLQGRYDAFNGLLLSGDGTGNFSPVEIVKSGFYVPGDAKSLVRLVNGDGEQLLIAAQNRGPLRVFAQGNGEGVFLSLEREDFLIEVTLDDGTSYKEEASYGAGFLSQSSRKVYIPKAAKEVLITNFKGETREHPLLMESAASGE